MGGCQLFDGAAIPLRALAVDLALVDQRLHHLFDEERVAVGLGVHGGGELVADGRLSQQRRQHRRRVLPREPAERPARGEAPPPPPPPTPPPPTPPAPPP